MTTEDPGQHGAEVPEETGRSQPRDEASAEEGPAQPSIQASRRARPVATVLALALACFAAAAAGFLWWQYRQFYVALDQADGETAVALRELRAELRGLKDSVAEAGEDRAELRRTLERAVERIDTFPARFADLDERVAAAQGVSADARRRWLRAQAEYYLGVANSELALRRDRGNAMAALELADQALADAGNPAFAAVRERIAGELQALRGLQVPDVEGLSYSLSSLAERVGELPMRLPAAGEDAGTRRGNDIEPGLGRLWQSFKNALSSMFSIERSDTAAVYSLSRNQQTLVRRQLELELTLARLGLAQAMPELFRGSLEAARTLLEEHFATGAPAVEGALALLGDMLELDIAPRYPDISGSLTVLRNLSDRAG